MIQEATDTRLAYERDQVAFFFCDKIARNLLGLLQLFATAESFARIVGPDGAVQFQPWSADTIQGEFGFGIKVNSQLRPDSAADLKRITDVVNLSAKSPYVRQVELWRIAMQAWGFDPNRIIQEPPPPSKEEPKVSLALSLSPADFANPLTQPYAIQMAQAAGLKIQLPQLQPPPNQLTPGTNEEADKLSKHKSLQTGQLDGAGAETGMAPMVQ